MMKCLTVVFKAFNVNLQNIHHRNVGQSHHLLPCFKGIWIKRIPKDRLVCCIVVSFWRGAAQAYIVVGVTAGHDALAFISAVECVHRAHRRIQYGFLKFEVACAAKAEDDTSGIGIRDVAKKLLAIGLATHAVASIAIHRRRMRALNNWMVPGIIAAKGSKQS